MTINVKRFWPWRWADQDDAAQVDEVITSAQLRSYISDPNGTGATVFTGSPALTGNPTAPTPSTSDNDTSIATTAFVKAQSYGDVSGPASSVDSEVALFSGTGGKTIKRAAGTGIASLASGVLSASTSPALGTPTTTTIQTSGNVGLGTAPSGTAGTFLLTSDSADENTVFLNANSNAAGTSALTAFKAQASTAISQLLAHGAGRVATRYGVTVANYGELLVSAGSGLLVGSNTNVPIIFGTNNLERMRISGAGAISFSAPAQLNGYTVATLPAGVTGYIAYVTDALAPTFGTAVTGGGAVVIPVFYNGANWVSF